MAETVQPFRQHMQQEHFTRLNNTLFDDLFPLFVRQKRCIFRYPFLKQHYCIKGFPNHI